MNFKRKLKRSKMPHKHPSRNKDPWKIIREAAEKFAGDKSNDETGICKKN